MGDSLSESEVRAGNGNSEIVLTPGGIATQLEAAVSGLFLRAAYIPQVDGSRRAEYWHHVADPAAPARFVVRIDAHALLALCLKAQHASRGTAKAGPVTVRRFGRTEMPRVEGWPTRKPDGTPTTFDPAAHLDGTGAGVVRDLRPEASRCPLIPAGYGTSPNDCACGACEVL